jgi:hypothetical protein
VGDIVQVVSAVLTASGSSISVGITPTAGNLLYVASFQEARNAATVTASGYSFDDYGGVEEAAINCRLTHSAAKNIPAGAATILSTFAGSGPFREIVVVECEDADTASPMDDETETTDTGQNPTATGTLTSTTTQAFGLSMGVDLQSTGLGAGTNWTNHALYFDSATEYTVRLQKRTVTATGDHTYNFVNTSISRNVTVGVLFKDLTTFTPPSSYTSAPSRMAINQRVM